MAYLHKESQSLSNRLTLMELEIKKIKAFLFDTLELHKQYLDVRGIETQEDNPDDPIGFKN